MTDQTISNALKESGAYRAIRLGQTAKLDQALESAFFRLFGFNPKDLLQDKEDKNDSQKTEGF